MPLLFLTSAPVKSIVHMESLHAVLEVLCGGALRKSHAGALTLG